MATEQTHTVEHGSAEALREVQRQLIRIHYPLAEAAEIDVDLQRRTLDRLMRLMKYVDASLEDTRPDSSINGHA